MKKAMKDRPITANQCRKIHALKGALALPDDTYRMMLKDTFRVESCTVLSLKQAGVLIELLEERAVGMGVWTPKVAAQRLNHPGAKREGMATPAQLRKIEAVWQEVSRIEEQQSRSKALRAFVQRTGKVSDLRFLTRQAATDVLNGLEAMQRQQRPEVVSFQESKSRF